MPLEEQMYCKEQIVIPPDFPDILKQFVKAAIRTQPRDIVVWSYAYFLAMSKGEPPPVKVRLEHSDADHLSIGLLIVLHKQLGHNKVVKLDAIREKWQKLALSPKRLDELIDLGHLHNEVLWIDFLALACGTVSKDITDSLRVLCEILTEDPEGGPARVPYNDFYNGFKFVTRLDSDILTSNVDAVVEYLSEVAKKQDGMIQPRNFINNPDCPPLS